MTEATPQEATQTEEFVERAVQFRADWDRLETTIGEIIVGQTEVVRGVLTALFADGHCLLEGVPGLGKTLLVRTLAKALDLEFGRIQFTPDLMPADLTGTQMIVESEDGSRSFRLVEGPVFTNILLADEINRATPKTQAALLEAMQERQLTVGGKLRKLKPPFLVLATQNPIEMQGTYPLPEAQMDRFLLKLKVAASGLAELEEIIERTTGGEKPFPGAVINRQEILRAQETVRQVYVAPHVESYASRIVLAIQPGQSGSELALEPARSCVRYGPSPRGAQALTLGAKVLALLDGRYNVAFEDIESIALAALRHRVSLNYEAIAGGVDVDELVGAILASVREERLRPLAQ